MKMILSCILPAALLIAGCGKHGAAKGSPASLDELNRALAYVSMTTHEFPPATSNLVKYLGYMGKTLPEPPAGKQLVIDPVTHQFVLTDK